MAKDPAFLMYPKDWLEGTGEMTAAEKGVYIDLLCYQHQRGHIPQDTKRIALMVGLPHDEFLTYWGILKDKFSTQEDGKLFNKKLKSVSGERSEYSRMRAIIGTFGSLLRAANLSNANAAKARKLFNYKDFLTIEGSAMSKEIGSWLANCQAKRLPDHEDGDEIEDEDLNTNTFKEFWEIYPRKTGKADAEKAWGVLNPNAELMAKIKLTLSVQKKAPDWIKENGKFIPYPATWIRGRRWEDEIGNKKDILFTQSFPL